MDFKEINNYYIVFTKNINIATFLNSYPGFYKGYSVLITWLDSTDVKEVISLKRLQEINVDYKMVNKYFFFNSLNFQNLLKNYSKSSYSFFTHFDEIYFFNNTIPLIAPNRRFISDSCYFDSEIPESFFKTMNNIGAERYLSNGCGLNIASRTEIDVEKIAEIERNYKD